MALPLSNSFETGLADETAITAANSDDGAAGDAFDAVGGELLFDTLRAAHGTLSCKCVVDAVETANIDWSTSIGVVTDLYVRLYLYMTANPGGNQRLIRTKNSSNVDVCFVQIGTSGEMFIVDASGNVGGVTLPLNEWVRVEYHVLADVAAGEHELRIYSLDSTTLLDSSLRSGVNTGADIDVLAIGNATAQNVGTFWMDDLAASGTGWIGPVASGDTGLAWIGA